MRRLEHGDLWTTEGGNMTVLMDRYRFDKEYHMLDKARAMHAGWLIRWRWLHEFDEYGKCCEAGGNLNIWMGNLAPPEYAVDWAKPIVQVTVRNNTSATVKVSVKYG